MIETVNFTCLEPNKPINELENITINEARNSSIF